MDWGELGGENMANEHYREILMGSLDEQHI
jgi:hypothetical protein